MPPRNDHRLIGIDPIGVFRRHDRVQRGLNTCELGLQRDESCVLVKSRRLEFLVFRLELLDQLCGVRKGAVGQITADQVACYCAAQQEDHAGSERPKPALTIRHPSV